jgi:hypothetical protein
MALESWQSWSRRVRCRAARSLPRARKSLEEAATALGAPLQALPWTRRGKEPSNMRLRTS